MFDRILVPVDGSKAVRPAIEKTITLAAIHDAEIYALHIVDQPAPVAGTGEGVLSLENLFEALEEDGKEATSEIAARAQEQGIEATAEVRRGTPREDILPYAAENDIDLIVIGTHGRTGVKRAVLGSVTEAVVRHADIPVLTVCRESGE